MTPSASKSAVSPQPTIPPVSITDAPVDAQPVQHDDKLYTTVKEGLAYILIPPDAPRLLDPKTHASEPAQSVFYNPIQQYNRDLTVLAIRAFGEDFLARQTLKSKRKKVRRGGQHARGKESAKNKAGEGKTSAELNAQAGEKLDQVEGLESKKRKLDAGEVAQDGSKRQKLTGEPAEFEDDGIDDDDLLAVESSLRDNGIIPTGEIPTENGARQEKLAGGEIPASNRLAEEQDTRPQFRILDALSATGLRALRYAKELPFNIQVTANDLSKNAVESIKLNIKHNRMEKKIKTSVGNANAHMYSFVAQEGTGSSANKYHVIDIDPYGTAVPFLDAAVQATADNGLLCVTCTDTGVFNSMGYAEKAFALYGGMPGKGEHCHEIGLRLILHAITTTAAKYGIAIEPLLSLSIDYYARVFVRVKKSPAEVKFLASKTMLVYACDHGCGAWTQQFMMRTTEQPGKKGSHWHKHSTAQGPTSDRLCECCGSKMHIAGPMYGGPLHNPSFIQKVLDLIPSLDDEIYKTLPRIEGMLSLAQEEMALHDASKLTIPNQLSKQVDQSSKQKSTNVPKPTENTEQSDSAKEKSTIAESTNGTKAQATAIDEASKREQTTSVKEELPKEDSQPDLTTRLFEPLNPHVFDHHPFYIIPSSLSRVLHCQAPSDAAFRGALKGLGFQTVRSHAQPGTIKTDAPWDSIWDVMVAWTKEVPIREGALKEGMAGYVIMKRVAQREKARLEAEQKNENVSVESDGVAATDAADKKKQSGDPARPGKQKIVFDEKLGKEPLKAKRLVRYQINPRANWGPMARAK